jgi:hypothetical protein
VVGDSLVGLSAEEIEQALADRDLRSLQFLSGRTLGQLQPMLAAAAAQVPWAVVISAGTNDSYEADRPWDAALERMEIETTLARFPESCVVWLTLNEQMPPSARGVDPRPHAIEWNQVLRTTAARIPRLKLADWNALLDERGRERLMLSDGVHPDDVDGQPALAGLIEATLDTCDGGEAIPAAHRFAGQPRPGRVAARLPSPRRRDRLSTTRSRRGPRADPVPRVP